MTVLYLVLSATGLSIGYLTTDYVLDVIRDYKWQLSANEIRVAHDRAPLPVKVRLK